MPVRAKSAEVWAFLVDVERWPQWTDSMQDVRIVDGGPLRVGSVVAIKQPRMPRFRWRVTDLRPGRSFTWQNQALGVMTTAEHRVDSDERETSLTLTIRLEGPMAAPLCFFFDGLYRTYLDMELDGLRRAVEAMMS